MPVTYDVAARTTDVLASRGIASLIFVVDNDASRRKLLEPLISAQGWQVETFALAANFLSRPRPVGPCCLVVDSVLPGISSLELQRQVSGRMDMPVIFIGGASDVATSVQAMKAGAFDFLIHPLDADVLLAVIDQALAQSHAALLHEAEMHVLQTRYASLTPRERDVMALVVSGLLNKQVGGELGISEITVKAHRGQVMRKMKADSLPALVTMAARLGAAPSVGTLRGSLSTRRAMDRLLLGRAPRELAVFAQQRDGRD